ncbi:MAG: thiamine phosphate synthase [Nitrospiraceae bacterium]
MSAPFSHASSLKGLYVILDAQALRGRSLVDALREAASGGSRLFQYRDKTSSALEMYRQALQLRRAAADAGAHFLINDRCDLALAVDADGVHLGQEDLPPPLARRVLGAGKIIGVSTHGAAQVREATESGADYLGFGPIFPTATKPHHEPVVGIEGLRQVRPLTRLPIFAIGGVTVDTVEAVVGAGANGVAVVSAILDSPDIAGTVRAFMARLS